MASQCSFWEDNGAWTAGRGATRTQQRQDVNWKNIDDSTTAYSTQPITAGNNSFIKYQFGALSGTFNTIQNGKFGHTTGTFGGGLTLWLATGTGIYAPTTTLMTTGTVNITAASGISQAFTPILFAQNDPTANNPAASITTTGYTTYIATQLATTTGAAPGDTSVATLTLQYDES